MLTISCQIIPETLKSDYVQQPVDRSHKAAPPPEPEAGEGVKVVDGEVKELTVKDGEVQPES